MALSKAFNATFVSPNLKSSFAVSLEVSVWYYTCHIHQSVDHKEWLTCCNLCMHSAFPNPELLWLKHRWDHPLLRRKLGLSYGINLLKGRCRLRWQIRFGHILAYFKLVEVIRCVHFYGIDITVPQCESGFSRVVCYHYVLFHSFAHLLWHIHSQHCCSNSDPCVFRKMSDSFEITTETFGSFKSAILKEVRDLTILVWPFRTISKVSLLGVTEYMGW